MNGRKNKLFTIKFVIENAISYKARACRLPWHGVQHMMISVVIFFRIFEIFIFCFVVAIGLCDLVHDVETIFHLSYVLTASGNKIAVSRASLIFQKRFPDPVNT